MDYDAIPDNDSYYNEYEEYHGRAMTEVVLMAYHFLRYYSVAIFALGGVLNLNSLIVLYSNRRRYNCFAYLLGILIGNLVFLGAFGTHLLLRFLNTHEVDHVLCRAVIYIMTAHRYFPVLCLMAISIDRYLYLVHWKLGGRPLESGRPGSRRVSYLIVAGILAICLISQLWLIPMVKWQPNYGCSFAHLTIGEPTIMTTLQCINIVLLYFIPFVVSTTFNAKLLATLFSLKHKATDDDIPMNELEHVPSTTLLNSKTSMCSQQQPRSLAPSDRRRSPSPCSSREPLERRTSAIFLSYQLNKRLANKKRKLAVVLVVVMSFDMILNFPNHFMNLLTSYDNDFMNRHPTIFITLEIVAYVLWHLQCLVSALLVRVPLLWSTNRKSSTGKMKAPPKKMSTDKGGGPGVKERNSVDFSSSFLERLCSVLGIRQGKKEQTYPRVWKWPKPSSSNKLAEGVEPSAVVQRDWLFL